MSRRFDGRDDLGDPELVAKVNRDGDPASLGTVLDQFMANLGAPPVSVTAALSERWSEVVGPNLASGTRPVELVDRVLTIGCAEAAMAAQIGWMEAQIRQRFTEAFGADLVDRVVTRVDR